MSKTARASAAILAVPVLGLYLLWHSGPEAGPSAWIFVVSVLAVMLAAIFIAAVGDVILARRRIIFWSGMAIAIVGPAYSYIWFRVTGHELAPDHVAGTAWTLAFALVTGICLAILPRSVAVYRRMTTDGAEAPNPRQLLSLLGMTVAWIAIVLLAWRFGTYLPDPWLHYVENDQAPPDGPYFPPSQKQSFVACQSPSASKEGGPFDDFEMSWYSRDLRAAHEPSLYQQSATPSAGNPASSYRFTWLRSFHPVMTVRVDEINGKMVLTAKRLTGDGGHPSPKSIARMVRRELTRAEGEKISNLLNAAKPVRITCGMGFDGAEWIVETRIGTSYHYAAQWSPDEGPIREFGLYMLSLTGLNTDPVY